MGKKKDALRAELDELRAIATDNQSIAITAERENAALREQLAALASPVRLITDTVEPTVRVKIAKALGIVVENQTSLTDDAILTAIERLLGPKVSYGGDPEDHPAMTKGDSLAEAIMHNKAERGELHGGLVQARGVIQRVAGALGVGQWAPDGEEIVEKAQRFGVFAYWLRKRLHERQAHGEHTTGDIMRNVDIAVIDELRTILAALVAEKELAKLLQNKPVKVSKTVLDLAENQPPSGDTYLDRPFTVADIIRLRNTLHQREIPTAPSNRADNERTGDLVLILERIYHSPEAEAEFCAFMNAVVLPVLRKHNPAALLPKEN